MIKINSFRAADGGGAYRLEIRRDGEEKSECFYILAAHQREYEFAKGEYPDEVYAVIRRLDQICRAVRSGRRILCYGANSRAALRMKLLAKGISPECTDEAIEMLLSESGISESSDVVRLCEVQMTKRLGARRIISYLYDRGYTDDVIADAKEYLAQIDFAPICRRVIDEKYGGVPTDFDIKKKCIDYLLRQGFSYNEIKKAFEN